MIRKISRLIGVVIIVFILSKLDLTEIKEIFFSSNKYYLIFGFLLTIVSIFAKSLRWNYLKKIQGIKYSITNSFVMYSASLLVGLATPGRLGELSKLFYLKNDGYSYGKSLFNVVIDRLFDMFFLLVFGAAGMFFFFNLFKKEIPYILIFTVIALIFVYLFIKTNLLKAILSRAFNFIIPVKYQKSWQVNLQDFIVDLKSLKAKHYLFALAITCISWLLYYFQMSIFARAIGIDISFLYLAISTTVAGIVTMIPISYSGIGTRDLVLITLFSLVFISKESAVTLSSLILFTHIFMAIMGFVCWLKKPLRLK